ncbi:MAG: hypothetical protein EOO61_07210, partial [Hymenobacter sp.]
MLSGKELNQENNGTGPAYQAENIHFHGLTYADTKQIALDLWRDNALQFSREAAQIAKDRVDEFLDSLLEQLGKKNTELFNSLRDPSMQIAVFDAQKQFAKYADRYTADILIEFLVQKANGPTRSWNAIMIDEALTVVPRLTKSMMDTLTILFISNQLLKVIKNFEQWSEIIVTVIPKIIEFSAYEAEQHSYLKYIGCVEGLAEKENKRTLFESAMLE